MVLESGKDKVRWGDGDDGIEISDDGDEGMTVWVRVEPYFVVARGMWKEEVLTDFC